MRIAVAMAFAVVAGETRSMAFFEYLPVRLHKLTQNQKVILIELQGDPS